MQDSTLGPNCHAIRACPAAENLPILPPFLFPEGAVLTHAGRWNPVNPSHPWGSLSLPAMTDDRHADALGVTRRERRREYQGTGGRDEEAPAPEGAEAPRRHEDGKPRIRGEDTA